MTKDNEYGIIILHDPSTTDGKNRAYKTVFDLIAIHGLNGDPINTWTHTETGVMWLRDLLPAVIPDICIMTFGYNARFKNFTAQALGTPHNGSSLAAMGKVLANIVSAFSPIRAPRALIGMLQKDSEVLLEITEDFLKRRRKVQLVSFYELEFTSIGPFLRRLIVDQCSVILNVPYEIAVPQFADHRNIARFRSSQDRSYRPVVSRLKVFAQTLRSGYPKSSISLDLRTQPCSFFCGRDDVFNMLKTFFYEDQGQAQGRWTFAICGLNFDHLHDLLKLGDSKDKISAVKGWLSWPENTENGHILSPLMENDAVQLLLEKLGIQNPTAGDIEDARTITGLLRSLPLTLVQAGAFIRSRHRSLWEYSRLYMTQRDYLLGFILYLGDSEKAVLTTWEINFKTIFNSGNAATSRLLSSKKMG
ncbi:LipA and NB-ARC domain protein [Aspergillus novofumigatus IBT 16806]|uniref:Uncharacterized protein n=1 Tax=Aspergillus novofumigatus (strain IBT 16806) TaxID=1392255 RepID=A0A2I1CF56_ASPN1|nr:uncharacterized protein P174DRAFT_501108 [Aspergillus novofumigatus IBT 16806]PKX96267.1 hypothetical protein P174DRAFT_501108 [Aspergillus novofumigatus IBT 16806]